MHSVVCVQMDSHADGINFNEVSSKWSVGLCYRNRAFWVVGISRG